MVRDIGESVASRITMKHQVLDKDNWGDIRFSCTTIDAFWHSSRETGTQGIIVLEWN